MGSGAKPPTEGSKAFAKKQLAQSKRVGSVGPNPSFNKLNKTGINSVASQTVKVPVPMGFKMKLGSSRFLGDPLVQRLSTEAGRAEVSKLAQALHETECSESGAQAGSLEDIKYQATKGDNAYLKRHFSNYPNAKSHR